jgi:hypothetical protein
MAFVDSLTAVGNSATGISFDFSDLVAILAVLVAVVGPLLIARANRKQVRVLQAENAKSSKELEELRAKLEKGAFTHRMQFENEYGIYNRIWEETTQISLTAYGAAYSLGKVLQASGKVGVEEELTRHMKLLEEHDEKMKDFMSQVENIKPFVSEKIFKSLFDLHRKLFSLTGWESWVAKEIVKEDPDLDEYGKQVAEQLPQIDIAKNAVCEAIKVRITLMTSEH